MNMKTLTALAVGAALALPFSALAEDKASSGAATGASVGSTSPGHTPEGRAAATFKSLDSDNDGHLSIQEMKGNQYETQFSNLDQDRDGLLAFQEYMVTAGASASVGSGARSSAGGSSAGGPATDGHWAQRYRRAHGGASGGAGTPATKQ
jgi:hypothetical protein